MRINASNFELIAGPEQNGPCIDYEFRDKSPKTELRTWKLWLDAETGEWLALMCRSETEYDTFDHDVRIAKAFIPVLRAAIPADAVLHIKD